MGGASTAVSAEGAAGRPFHEGVRGDGRDRRFVSRLADACACSVPQRTKKEVQEETGKSRKGGRRLPYPGGSCNVLASD